MQKLDLGTMIRALRDTKDVGETLESPVKTVFLLLGDLLTIEDLICRFKKHHKNVFLHLNLIQGISKDAAGLNYLTHRIKPDGIITTQVNLINEIKKKEMIAVQRLFVFDTLSLKSGIKSLKESNADMVEVLPGVIPKIIKAIKKATDKPIIAGGLITSKEEIDNILAAGATAVSVSSQKLWR